MDPQTWAEFIRYDESGQPLANPIQYEHDWRWTLGGDVEDTNLTETCAIAPAEGWRWCYSGSWTVQSDDHSIVYPHMYHTESSTTALYKFQWVPNDLGVQDQNFEVEISTMNNYIDQEYDDTYIYLPECNYKEQEVRSYFHIVDYTSDEGEYIGFIDHSEALETVDDFENYGGLMNAGMSQSTFTADGLFIGGNHCGCLRVAVEPRYYFEDETDTIRWMNDNGDLIFDNNYESDSERPWVCMSLGSTHSNHGFAVDSNNFLECSHFFGTISFEAGAPDGTGIGKYSYAGEVDQQKAGNLIMDTNSAFDGCYTQTTGELSGGINKGGVWYIARDSIKGVIKTGGVSVEESGPSAFSVAQNSPNPFNPTTTISYSLADAGNVTIDVFNVAGQKIDTLVDGFMEAGSHSIVWDGSDVSAGVYFYTVKAGNFTKTIKMTLLK